MKWSMTTVGVIILGLIGVAVIILFQNLTTSSENDYYLLKEITESAMFDAIDLNYYRETGDIKIIREKFVENFTRRYAESTLFIGGKYIISFFDIMETPPKVSLLVNTDIVDYKIYGESTKNTYNVQNSLSGIFEYNTGNKNENNIYVMSSGRYTYYSMPGIDEYGHVSADQPFYIPDEISQKSVKPGSIAITFSNVRASNSIEDILQAKLRREIDWVRATNEEGYGTNYYGIIDTSKYATSCNIGDIYYYDCENNTGIKNEKMMCGKYNNFWLHWDGTCSSGVENVLLVIDMDFQYEEYVY